MTFQGTNIALHPSFGGVNELSIVLLVLKGKHVARKSEGVQPIVTNLLGGYPAYKGRFFENQVR
jgi:hypothetical protein